MKVTMISNYKLFKAKSLEAIQGALEKNLASYWQDSIF